MVVGMDSSTSTAVLLRRILILMMLFDECARCLELLELRVPAHVALGARAALACRWQLGPADVLYSVKWYKDGKEFFRHVPRDSEPRRRFPLPGVDVENVDTIGSILTLFPSTLESEGRYRCEVSGEGPLFPTVTQYADMDIIALPDHGPIITGLNSKYRLGDCANVSCSSGRSRPATQLAWYINGEPLPVEKYTSSYKSEQSLIVAISTMRFDITETSFKKSTMKVKCLATISPIYWKSTEETSILESSSVSIFSDLPSISKNQKAKRFDRNQPIRNLANHKFTDNYFSSWIFLGVVLTRLFCGRLFKVQNTMTITL